MLLQFSLGLPSISFCAFEARLDTASLRTLIFVPAGRTLLEGSHGPGVFGKTAAFRAPVGMPPRAGLGLGFGDRCSKAWVLQLCSLEHRGSPEYAHGFTKLPNSLNRPCLQGIRLSNLDTLLADLSHLPMRDYEPNAPRHVRYHL